MAYHLAQIHDVWVLTQNYYQRPIEEELTKNPVSGLHFVYYDLPSWAHQWWHRGQQGIQLHYYLWQLGVYNVARRLHRHVLFDVAHHLTLGRYWTPSLLFRLPIPFIFGPVGGGESAPSAFFSSFGLRGFIYEYVRTAVRFFGECDPLVQATIRNAKVILSPTVETRTRLKALGAKRIVFFPGQTGMNHHEIDSLLRTESESGNVDLRFISIARLLSWKGIHLGIQAFAAANIDGAEYWILGEGPERVRLQKLSENLNISHRVHFLGNLGRVETFKELLASHVFIHLSLHDFSPTVCLEAMAAQCPVICLDIGGPSMQVSEKAGVKLPASTPAQVINDATTAMKFMARNQNARQQMGQAGRERVISEYSWDRKAKLLDGLYQQVIQTD
ncbi:glycosyltransferase family 4 protein [Nitrospira sp. M1]